MLRITLLLAAMILISQAPDTLAALKPYKDYVIALLLSLLIKPWLIDQYR